MADFLRDQGDKARAWREARGLSRPALGRLIGYSPSTIEHMESARNRGTGKPVSKSGFLTYKLACAAVAANIDFDWGDITLKIQP